MASHIKNATILSKRAMRNAFSAVTMTAFSMIPLKASALNIKEVSVNGQFGAGILRYKPVGTFDGSLDVDPTKGHAYRETVVFETPFPGLFKVNANMTTTWRGTVPVFDEVTLEKTGDSEIIRITYFLTVTDPITGKENPVPGPLPFGFWTFDGHDAKKKNIVIDHVVKFDDFSFSYDKLLLPSTSVTFSALEDKYPVVSFFDIDYFDPIRSPCIPSPGPSPVSLSGGFCPIPEPSAWALMLMGFGVIGGAVRRRRSARVADGIAA